MLAAAGIAMSALLFCVGILACFMGGPAVLVGLLFFWCGWGVGCDALGELRRLEREWARQRQYDRWADDLLKRRNAWLRLWARRRK